MNERDDWAASVGSRRHQLIEEAKAELDVAYQEVKRVELKVLGDQHPAGAKPGNGRQPARETPHYHAGDDLETLYDLQREAVERFSIVSAAFAVVGMADDISAHVEALRDLLFHENEVRSREIEINTTLRDFVGGLHAFNLGDRRPENDRKVRQSWAETERILRHLGRKI